MLESIVTPQSIKKETSPEVSFLDLGLMDYSKALDEQLQWVAKVQEQPESHKVLLCSHPPVVTLGRSTKPGDISGWSGETVEIGRGGRATYHGPGQLVVYPIMSLKSPIAPIPKMDLHKYMGFLEETVVRALSHYGVQAQAKLSESIEQGEEKLQLTGVWVGDKKIASLGIGVKKWVTYHGIAINVNKDEKAYQGMNPCGFSKSIMTSLEELLGAPQSIEKFSHIYRENFLPQEI